MRNDVFEDFGGKRLIGAVGGECESGFDCCRFGEEEVRVGECMLSICFDLCATAEE